MTSEIQRLAETAGRACDAEQVLLFGSRARGAARHESDVDLALVVPDKVCRREALRAAIAATANRRIPLDLVVLSHSTWVSESSLFARQIRRDGILVYGK